MTIEVNSKLLLHLQVLCNKWRNQILHRSCIVLAIGQEQIISFCVKHIQESFYKILKRSIYNFHSSAVKKLTWPKKLYRYANI